MKMRKNIKRRKMKEEKIKKEKRKNRKCKEYKKTHTNQSQPPTLPVPRGSPNTHLDITKRSGGGEADADREEVVGDAARREVHGSGGSGLVNDRDAPHQGTVGAVVLVLPLALVDDGRRGSRGQRDGDDDLAQLKVKVLQVVLYVDVTAPGTILLRPAVD